MHRLVVPLGAAVAYVGYVAWAAAPASAQPAVARPAPARAHADAPRSPQRLDALLAAARDEDALRRRFGTSAVSRARLGVDDGETVPGTVLFATDSVRRVEILWRDTVAYRGPLRLVLRGRRSAWVLPGDVTLGTTLAALERANGRPFVLTGFGWDYGGGVVDWRGGALAARLGDAVRVYLSPDDARRSSADYATVLGDREYASSLPAMRRLAPVVTQIFVDAAR